MANSVDPDQTAPVYPKTLRTLICRLNLKLTALFNYGTDSWKCLLNYLIHVTRKPVFGVCDQGTLKLAYAAKKLGKGLKFRI